ncbi:hypothetical protein PGTUg99_022682 [Puccinia graminis f. sp. tritici]|uniref:Secreted protein n=1 Tax=Puccinia graminis f. sp. tritici TaxID=56615 RepID=A0A5B0RHC4_PUCGR|nr:hypothetical protein PGTUg99_022682 [Puccinia graminis f. sp. tritici]
MQKVLSLLLLSYYQLAIGKETSIEPPNTQHCTQGWKGNPGTPKSFKCMTNPNTTYSCKTCDTPVPYGGASNCYRYLNQTTLKGATDDTNVGSLLCQEYVKRDDYLDCKNAGTGQMYQCDEEILFSIACNECELTSNSKF